jgi:hypothetical protein
MYKPLILIMLLAGTRSTVNAQLTVDSVLVRQYRDDTLDFIPFPEAYVLDSIKLCKRITTREINTATSRTTFRNFYRYPRPKDKIADTIVLSKSLKGFGTFCPPSGCAWYISAKKKRKIITVDNLERMSDFIGKVDNKYDAYLWLESQSLAASRGIPVSTNSSIKYKPVKNGYLIRFNMRISDCFITYADVTYFIGRNKKVVLVRSDTTSVSQSCI